MPARRLGNTEGIGQFRDKRIGSALRGIKGEVLTGAGDQFLGATG